MERNKIYLGDCIELIKDIPDKSIDVTFTSPPYNRIRNDTYDNYDDIIEDYYKFLCDITKECLRVTRKDVIINIQMILFNKADLCRWIGTFAERIKGIVVWEKLNPQPATNFKDDTYSITNAYEFFFVLGGGKDLEFRANNKIRNIISTNVNNQHFKGHGAVMREDVAEHFIRNFSRKGDLVLDPFMGMGTTALVCKLNGRDYIGYEIDPEYRKRALERIEGVGEQMNMFEVS